LVWVSVQGQQRVRVPVELHALENKTAAVLATSLHKVTVDVASQALRSFGRNDRPWFVHIVVCDAVAANLKAAALLWAWIRSDTSLQGMRYLLFVTRCSSRQANLSIVAATTGRGAVVGCQNTAAPCVGVAVFERRRAVTAKGSKSPHLFVCGAIVRLYKYLVNDDYTEFLSNLSYEASQLQCVDVATHERAASLAKWTRLGTLYGSGVFPEGLLACLNAGLDEWIHVHSARGGAAAPCAGAAPRVRPPEAERSLEAAGQLVRSQLLEMLRRRFLVVDESPTLTRMFTFVEHLKSLLL
jgi:hypothetical protein